MQSNGEYQPRSWPGVLDATLCDKVCQWLVTGQWFSPGTLVSFTNKADHYDITEILLKVVLNTININQTTADHADTLHSPPMVNWKRNNYCSHEFFISNMIGSAEFGGLIICPYITFYWTRTLFYTTFIPYLDSKWKKKHGFILNFLIVCPTDQLNICIMLCCYSNF